MNKTQFNHVYPSELLTGLATSRLQYAFLSASIQMDVFNQIKGKKLTLEQFSKTLHIPASSARALVQNLSNMGLLQYEKGKICNSHDAETFLTDDDITKNFILWLSGYSPSPHKLISILRNPPRQPWYAIRQRKPSILDKFRKKPVQSYFYLESHELRRRWGKELANKYDFSKHTRLLDIGGACGGWTVGVLEKYPKLEAVIFERKEVVEITRAMLSTRPGIADRVQVTAGDFFSSKIPGNCDVVLLANILHDWSVNECQIILQNIIASVRTGTAILINEFFFDDNWKGTNYGALQAMLVLGPEGESGWQPSYSEMKKLLQKSGLHKITEKNNLIIAYKR